VPSLKQIRANGGKLVETFPNNEVQKTLSQSLSRRSFLYRSAAVGFSVPAIAGLLAACGDEDADDDGAATEPDTDTDDAAEDDDEVSAAPDDDDRELVVSWWMDITDLDPAVFTDSLATDVARQIYSYLVRVASGTFDEIEPDLAENWELTDDGLVYTFHLREGAQFHRDYGEVTAEEVQHALLRHKDPEVGSRYRTEAMMMDDIAIVDDYTIEIHMVDPYPALLSEHLGYVPGAITSPQALEDGGDRYSEQAVGSGPFYLEAWEPRESVRLIRFDEWYGRQSPFSSMRYDIIPEESTAEVALERGEIHMTYILEAETQDRILNHPVIGSESFVAPRTFFITCNFDVEPLSDKRVRQALHWAIDKDLLVEAVLLRHGQPTDTVLNPHVFGHLDERVYSYDPDRARVLLEEAGYGDGFQSSLLIYPPYGIPDFAAAIQDMWREIGVEVEIVQREWAQLVDAVTAGNFEMSLSPMLRQGPDQYLTPLFHSQNIPYPNSSRYVNEELDALIDEARITVDDDEREALYHDIQRILHDELPRIPLFNPLFVLAFQPWISGAVPGLLSFNTTELSIEE
jgi:peptide/nickel transport system substrate-binding protein